MFVSSDTRYNERLMVQAQRIRTTPIAGSDGVEGNRRLTSLTAIPLLGLLFVEGLTVLFGVRQELRIHVFVGMLLVPPIGLKLASVGYRFIRYYTGSRAYRLAGPPHWVMRSLGPIVVLSTITLFASGIYLIVIGRSGLALTLHKLSFIIWGAVMAVHVLVYARRLPGVVVEEWSRRTRDHGTAARLAAVGVSLAVGVGLAALTVHLAGSYHHHSDGGFGDGH
jgi:hypothetical protein